MGDNKTTRIEIRLTEKEKEQIKNYVNKNNTTISKLFREIIQRLIKGEE